MSDAHESADTSFSTLIDQKLLRQFIESFNRAEAQIKVAELVDKQIAFPAINQLRYAAYHLVLALSDSNREKSEPFITTSIKHCQRAYYDAREVVLIFYLEKVAQFQDQFSNSPAIIKCLPEYTKLLISAQDARNHIEDVHSNLHECRDTVFNSCDAHCQTLKNVVDQFDLASPLIAKSIDEDAEAKQTATRRFITNALIGTSGVLIGAAALAVAIYNLAK